MATTPGTTVDREQVFGMAQQEMEYRVDLFNKLTQTCFDKCVERKYKEADLNAGENGCIDRCVSKYWQGTGTFQTSVTTPEDNGLSSEIDDHM